ncbi:unnamed protein product [Allacma fusca]|uniref:Uncharacterized protein n=1 Tax=Allacma fusca TaxID=39272 RepID=A0A8J2P6W2_9HEXA|nr:unnamed protein product [Allacma fusca]
MYSFKVGRDKNVNQFPVSNSNDERFDRLEEKLSNLENKINNKAKIWEDELKTLYQRVDLFPERVEKFTEHVTEWINKQRHDICQNNAQNEATPSSTTGNYSKRHIPQQRNYSKNAETMGMNGTCGNLPAYKRPRAHCPHCSKEYSMSYMNVHVRTCSLAYYR